jgi:hypothetical protein
MDREQVFCVAVSKRAVFSSTTNECLQAEESDASKAEERLQHATRIVKDENPNTGTTEHSNGKSTQHQAGCGPIVKQHGSS